MQKFICSILVGWTGLCVGHFAAAQTVMPLTPKMEPAKAPEVVVQFFRAYKQGLSEAGLPLFNAAAASKTSEDVEGKGCFEGPCLKQAEQQAPSAIIATLKVENTSKNYHIECRFYQNNKLLFKDDDRCDICTLSEATQSVLKLAIDAGKKLKSKIAAQPKVVPQGMLVPSEDSLQGEMTVKKPAKPQNAAPKKAKIAPSAAPAAVDLTPVANADSKASSSRFPLWPSLVTAGVGLVGLAIGIPLIAIDGNGVNCQGAPRPDNKNCADLYTTAGGGIALTTVGLASLTTSGVLLYLHLRSPKEQRLSSRFQQITFSPLPSGGVWLGTQGEF